MKVEIEVELTEEEIKSLVESHMRAVACIPDGFECDMRHNYFSSQRATFRMPEQEENPAVKDDNQKTEE